MGVRGGDWHTCDVGHVAVHVLTERARAFYRLEELWEEPPGHAGPQVFEAAQWGGGTA
jgi:ribosomal silencing factor RsfS